MRQKVLIVPDKFKGTLTAHAAAALLARGWHATRPDDELGLLPMSDGGDGFGQVLAELLHLAPRAVDTVDAAHRPHQGVWWWHDGSRTAVIESAQVIGLALLPPGKFHPFELDTFGLGALLRAAAEAEAEQCLVGIGGSATNDGGFGLARALGWRFLDGGGRVIERWTELASLADVIPPTFPCLPPNLLVAVDVRNPLLGPQGASRIYGPQKGLRDQDFACAESCLERLVEVTRQHLNVNAAGEPGAGAAGGLGYGLRAFCGAQLRSGFDIFAEKAELERRIREASLVITGEGTLDASTVMGKGVGEVARLCQKHGVPCIGLAGRVALPGPPAVQDRAFCAAFGIVPELASAQEALRCPDTWVLRLASQAADRYSASGFGLAKGGGDS